METEGTRTTESVDDEGERQRERNQALIALLDSWVEEDAGDDEEEERAALIEFMRAIDEDRGAGRKSYEAYLK